MYALFIFHKEIKFKAIWLVMLHVLFISLIQSLSESRKQAFNSTYVYTFVFSVYQVVENNIKMVWRQIKKLNLCTI